MVRVPGQFVKHRDDESERPGRPSRHALGIFWSIHVEVLLGQGLDGRQILCSARVPLPSVSFQPVGWFDKLDATYERCNEYRTQALWESTH